LQSFWLNSDEFCRGWLQITVKEGAARKLAGYCDESQQDYRPGHLAAWFNAAHLNFHVCEYSAKVCHVSGMSVVRIVEYTASFRVDESL
jgi:hypothetical protein